jgi:hypothetical protein
LSGSNSAASTLTITTVASTAAFVSPSRGPFLALFLPLPGLTLIGIGSRPMRVRKGELWSFACGALLTVTTIILIGCGGSAVPLHGSPGTAAGNYTITVTGTSGSLKHSITVPLAVN